MDVNHFFHVCAPFRTRRTQVLLGGETGRTGRSGVASAHPPRSPWCLWPTKPETRRVGLWHQHHSNSRMCVMRPGVLDNLDGKSFRLFHIRRNTDISPFQNRRWHVTTWHVWGLAHRTPRAREGAATFPQTRGTSDGKSGAGTYLYQQSRQARKGAPWLAAGPNWVQVYPSAQATWTTLEPPGETWPKYAASVFDFNR